MRDNFFSKLQKTYLIAEIGVNHNGRIDLAKEMILEAKESGADAVKFQTFSADTLVANGTPKVEYQKETTDSSETHYEMLKKLELSKDSHIDLFNFCKKNDIDFLSTPYDIDSAKFLDKLGVKIFKTASADIIDYQLQSYIASTNKPSIIASGMASIDEISNVINIYKENNNSNCIILHCVSNYPCSDESLNMKSINMIAKNFLCPIGYSDHSIGNLAAIVAVSYGAKVIEKHFTLDKSLPGPDHKASSTPTEFKSLVNDIRRTELVLGSEIKKIQTEEKQMSLVSRKSIFIKNQRKKGDKLDMDDLLFMRPGDGILADKVELVIGKVIKNNLEPNHKITWDDLEE